MNNQFLKILEHSFKVYLETDPRSNEKLKVLHGFVSKTLKIKLDKNYNLYSLGFGNGNEKTIPGRYMDKNVDITIEKNNKIVAGIGLKFVMSNYTQNSNNYFENMLGETANLRTNQYPYFQIFIVPEKIPYFDNDKNIKRWDAISTHNVDKYIKLSSDNTDIYFHSPNKTLFVLVNINPLPINQLKNKTQYINYFMNNPYNFSYSTTRIILGSSGIYNDFEQFIEKVFHSLLSM